MSVSPGQRAPRTGDYADGQAIAAARKARRLTQDELARKASISLSQLRKVEQGTRALTPGVRDALTAALGPARHRSQDASATARIASALPLLRDAMNAYDIPPDPAPSMAPLSELSQLTRTATTYRLASQYAKLAELLPRLITSLTAAALGGSGYNQEQVFRLLALAYRAADAIADKHGQYDMSARATDLVRWAATRSADPVVVQMSAYVRAEVFFNGPNARYGLRLLDAAAGLKPVADCTTAVAARGALLMRSAVLAAGAGMPDEAADRLAEARAAAQRLPDGIYHGTAFGPSSVRVHELAVAVESHDIGLSIKLSDQWEPPLTLPAERRSHFYIEAARAYSWAGNQEQAIRALWQARRAAPQHTRSNPAVTETVAALLRLSRKPSPQLQQFADWISVA
jgi:transcriptional regulator with XRE-family HTH domain